MNSAAAPASRPRIIITAVIAALVLAELACILPLTGGQVLFSQDDPYIHLALAERLAAGFHYGLNPGEMVAPASSILYPFLLAAMLKFGLGQAGALLICIASTFVSGLLLVAILEQSGYALNRIPPALLTILAAAVALAFNLIGLAFTGLEHALHVAVTLAVILGLLKFLRTGRIEWWWLAAAFASPLIRYEGASFWLATVLVLAWNRRTRTAAALFAAGAAALAGFSLFLHANGLPLLPNSVLVKIDAPASGAPTGLAAMAHTLFLAIYYNAQSYGFPQLIIMAALLAYGWRRAQRQRDGIAVQAAAFGIFVIAAHLFVGRFGWFGRYEIYVMLAAACLLAAVFAPAGARWAADMNRERTATLVLWLLAPMLLYPWRTLETPLAARNIYDQQHQMHRFVTDFYRGAVAVNDLGQISYRNPYYILDLWGLGSEEARRARAASRGTAWMDQAVQRHHIGLAILNPDWFAGRIPATWTRVATLTLRGPMITAATRDVAFYATRPDAVAPIRKAVHAFAPTLPADAFMEAPGG